MKTIEIDFIEANELPNNDVWKILFNFSLFKYEPGFDFIAKKSDIENVWIQDIEIAIKEGKRAQYYEKDIATLEPLKKLFSEMKSDYLFVKQN